MKSALVKIVERKTTPRFVLCACSRFDLGPDVWLYRTLNADGQDLQDYNIDADGAAILFADLEHISAAKALELHRAYQREQSK